MTQYLYYYELLCALYYTWCGTAVCRVYCTYHVLLTVCMQITKPTFPPSLSGVHCSLCHTGKMFHKVPLPPFFYSALYVDIKPYQKKKYLKTNIEIPFLKASLQDFSFSF